MRDLHPLTDDIVAGGCVFGGMILVALGIDWGTVPFGVGAGYVFGKHRPYGK